MKVKDGFSLRNISGTYVVLPLGERTLDFTGMLTLNETGRMLWLLLEQGSSRTALAEALVAEYGISTDEALSDVDEYVQSLVDAGCIEAE
jgi:hypothetical protein